MSPPSRERTHSVVQAYHRGWSTGHPEASIERLADDLVVECPIHDYPTRASFGEALAMFGRMVERVDLLAQLVGQGEAMLLYDMDVRGIGPLRVAEHFTIDGGRIVRLRQIHDTFALRRAGFGRS